MVPDVDLLSAGFECTLDQFVVSAVDCRVPRTIFEDKSPLTGATEHLITSARRQVGGLVDVASEPSPDDVGPCHMCLRALSSSCAAAGGVVAGPVPFGLGHGHSAW
jgi:hypothetical protein